MKITTVIGARHEARLRKLKYFRPGLASNQGVTLQARAVLENSCANCQL